jgi:hypothetical protein
MIFLGGVLFFGPILVALFAAALMLPRGFLGWYAFLAIAAILVFANLGDAHEDAALDGLGAFVFEVLAIGTVTLGLLVRCVIGEVRRQSEAGARSRYLRPSRFSIASQMRSSSTTLSKRLISCRPVGEVTLISVR